MIFKFPFTEGDVFETSSPVPPDIFKRLKIVGKHSAQDVTVFSLNGEKREAIWSVQYLKKCHYKKVVPPNEFE